ncbi:MAG: hypothetical protein ACLVJ8_12560 [Ruthenibacterium lactatiformans]
MARMEKGENNGFRRRCPCAVRKELSAALADARIDKIFEPTRDEVVLNLRTRTAIRACSFRPAAARPARA